MFVTSCAPFGMRQTERDICTHCDLDLEHIINPSRVTLIPRMVEQQTKFTLIQRMVHKETRVTHSKNGTWTDRVTRSDWTAQQQTQFRRDPQPFIAGLNAGRSLCHTPGGKRPQRAWRQQSFGRRQSDSGRAGPTSSHSRLDPCCGAALTIRTVKNQKPHFLGQNAVWLVPGGDAPVHRWPWPWGQQCHLARRPFASHSWRTSAPKTMTLRTAMSPCKATFCIAFSLVVNVMTDHCGKSGHREFRRWGRKCLRCTKRTDYHVSRHGLQCTPFFTLLQWW